MGKALKGLAGILANSTLFGLSVELAGRGPSQIGIQAYGERMANLSVDLGVFSLALFGITAGLYSVDHIDDKLNEIERKNPDLVLENAGWYKKMREKTRIF